MGISAEKLQQQQRGRKCACCSAVALVLGVVLLVVGIWASVMFARFTPVYKDITCTLQAPKLQPGTNIAEVYAAARSSKNLQLPLVQTTQCHNPNAYTVVVESSSPGGVFVGKDRERVATIEHIPTATMEAGKTGAIKAEVVIDLGDPKKLFNSAAPLLFFGGYPIYFESNMDIKVDAKTLFGSFKTERQSHKDCGLKMSLGSLTNVDLAFGPMSCADNFDHLELADVDPEDSKFKGVIVADAKRMGNGAEIEKATRQKNIGLGTAMGVGYGLGLILLVAGVLGLLRYRRLSREGGGADAVDDEERAAGASAEGATNSTKDMAPKVVAPLEGDTRETPALDENV